MYLEKMKEEEWITLGWMNKLRNLKATKGEDNNAIVQAMMAYGTKKEIELNARYRKHRKEQERRTDEWMKQIQNSIT